MHEADPSHRAALMELGLRRPGAVVSRRSALRAGLLGAVTFPAVLPLIGCSMNVPDTLAAPSVAPDDPSATASTSPSGASTGSAGSPGSRVLLAYYSRAGENYSYGGRTNLQVGNTEVAAQMISGLIACDVHRIEAAEPYPDSYDATVARNVTEQDEDARPALAQDLPDVSGYDVVLLGSPIWNVRPPMIMSTFTEGLDLAGKRALLFVTFAVSGLGSTQQIYGELSRSRPG